MAPRNLGRWLTAADERVKNDALVLVENFQEFVITADVVVADPFARAILRCYLTCGLNDMHCHGAAAVWPD